MNPSNFKISFKTILRARFPARISDWWGYLVPFLLGMIYINLYINKINFVHSLLFILGFLITISGTIAFGYFLNDITDKEIDVKAGKSNLAVLNTTKKNIFILLILLTIALFPWIFLPKNSCNIGFYILQLMLLVFYSVPPIRFKRFAIPSVITDALYNSVLPLLIISTTFITVLPSWPGVQYSAFLFVAVLWAFLKGLRGIILHQVEDRKNDQKSHIQSFANRLGPLKSIIIVGSYLLRLELIAFLVIIIYLSLKYLPYLWTIIPLFIFYIFFYFRLWENLKIRKREFRFSFLHILNDLYEDLLPVVFLFYLITLNPLFVLFLFIHIALFHRTFKKIFSNSKKIFSNFSDYKIYLKYKRIFYIGKFWATYDRILKKQGSNKQILK